MFSPKIKIKFILNVGDKYKLFLVCEFNSHTITDFVKKHKLLVKIPPP